LNELSAARLYLLTAAKKAVYDAQLRADSEEHTLEPVQPAWNGPDLRSLESTHSPIARRAAKGRAFPLMPVIIASVSVLAIGVIAFAFMSGRSKPVELVQTDEDEQPAKRPPVATETGSGGRGNGSTRVPAKSRPEVHICRPCLS